MNSLWQISNELLLIEQQLEELGGEITPEIEQALEITQKELQSKCLNYVHFINHIQTQISEAEIYKSKVLDYISKKEKLLERLKNALNEAVTKFGTIETDMWKLSQRKSESVEIVDLDKVPDKFKTIKQNIQADKTAIKQALKNGENIEGAKLIEKQNLQIK